MSIIDQVFRNLHSTIISTEHSVQETLHEAAVNISGAVDSFNYSLQSLGDDYRYFYSGVWREGANGAQKIVGDILEGTTIAGAAAAIGLGVYTAATTSVGIGVLKGLAYGGAILLAGTGFSGCAAPGGGEIVRMVIDGTVGVVGFVVRAESSRTAVNQINNNQNIDHNRASAAESVVDGFSIENNSIIFDRPLEFDFNSSEIRPDMYLVLDSVSRFIGQHPEIQRVNIVAHADGRNSEYNFSLASRRASIIRNYMISRGVNCAYEATGTVVSGPMIDEAQSRNRRVEFIILHNN